MLHAPFLKATFFFFFNFSLNVVIGQCSFTSSDGYTVTIALKPNAVVTNTCDGNGFQYQMKYSYNISFSTPPPANKGLYTLQGIFNCGSISINLPTAGGSGTVTSDNRAYYSGSSPACAAATPSNISCGNYFSLHIFANGIPDQTVNCTFANSINVLPVTFLDLTATTLSNGYAKLIWSTASETNNSYFTVEKSFDSKNWTAIGKVTGAGTSTQINNYTFEDNSSSFSTAYYRIKQIDIDGNFSYSSIATTNFSTNNKMGIYPNPNAGNTININGLRSTIGWQLKLMNVASQTVYATTLLSNQLQLPQIPAGVYFIQLFNTTTGTSSVYKYLKN